MCSGKSSNHQARSFYLGVDFWQDSDCTFPVQAKDNPNYIELCTNRGCPRQEQLYAVQERLPTGDIVFVMGNLNAKAGFDNTFLGHVMCFGNRNDNGGRFVNFCSFRHCMYITREALTSTSKGIIIWCRLSPLVGCLRLFSQFWSSKSMSNRSKIVDQNLSAELRIVERRDWKLYWPLWTIGNVSGPNSDTVRYQQSAVGGSLNPHENGWSNLNWIRHKTRLSQANY